MISRSPLLTTALLVLTAALAGAASAQDDAPDYTRTGLYFGAGFTGADYWGDRDGAEGVGGQLRIGSRFEQGDAVVGGGFELWARMIYLHNRDINRDLNPFSINVGPVLWFMQGRVQPFVRVGIGLHGARMERNVAGGPDEDEIETSFGVSGGAGVDYYLTERLAVYGIIDLEAPISNDSQLQKQESWGGTIGFRWSFR